jgi:hypothetical protein
VGLGTAFDWSPALSFAAITCEREVFSDWFVCDGGASGLSGKMYENSEVIEGVEIETIDILSDMLSLVMGEFRRFTIPQLFFADVARADG